jgi:hypothetical protein
MSSGAVVSSLIPRTRLRANWLISPREDLTWFIGSSLAGYLAVALMWAGFPILPLQFVWFFAIDGPHSMFAMTRSSRRHCT